MSAENYTYEEALRDTNSLFPRAEMGESARITAGLVDSTVDALIRAHRLVGDPSLLDLTFHRFIQTQLANGKALDVVSDSNSGHFDAESAMIRTAAVLDLGVNAGFLGKMVCLMTSSGPAVGLFAIDPIDETSFTQEYKFGKVLRPGYAKRSIIIRTYPTHEADQTDCPEPGVRIPDPYTRVSISEVNIDRVTAIGRMPSEADFDICTRNCETVVWNSNAHDPTFGFIERSATQAFGLQSSTVPDLLLEVQTILGKVDNGSWTVVNDTRAY